MEIVVLYTTQADLAVGLEKLKSSSYIPPPGLWSPLSFTYNFFSIDALTREERLKLEENSH